MYNNYILFMGAFFMNCLLIKPVSPEFKMHQALYALENISSKRQKEFLFIYPCTRTDKVVGKNLVLFDVNDAIPLEDTIRERVFE